MKGLFVSGSGTDVGKTFVANYIIQALNSRYRVVARKPIESDCIKTPQGLVPKDATLLNNACAHSEQIEEVCKFQFEACVSGEKASNDQGVNITLDDLVVASQPVNIEDFVVIEGAGGLYSPIAKQLLNSDLAKTLNLPLVLVVKDELGAINQALLCLQAAKDQNLKVLMLVLNQIKSNSLENAQAISQYTDTSVVTFNRNNVAEFFNKVRLLIQQG
ncbi:dethiobiotin synthase [Candidatus Thioglobus sp.]|jgi:dethiobiotin synthase (EC 6.3.3.3)|uniref:dethiobiotin synthase n=1 Tax=Candidatus Thioglobus sp. TaxID=2026721 RepID=UPI003242AEF8